MTTAASQMTLEEFARHAAEHGRCEIVREELRDVSPTGARHGDVTARLHYFLCQHVYEQNLGRIFAAETGFRLDDDGKLTVRAPDISFVDKSREAATETKHFVPIAPDLAVETLSPDDHATEVAEKVVWWLRHGAQLVRVVDPENRTVTVHRPDRSAHVLRTSDALDGRQVLPRFSLVLTKLFSQFGLAPPSASPLRPIVTICHNGCGTVPHGI